MPPAETAVVSSRSRNDRRALAIPIAYALTATLLLGVWTPVGQTLAHFGFAAFLAVAVAVMSRRTIAIATVVFSGEFVPLLVAITVVPELAPFVALAVMAAKDPSRRVKVGNVSMFVLSTFAGVVSTAAVPEAGAVLSSAVACAGFLLVNAALAGIYFLAIGRMSFRTYVTTVTPSVLATGILLVPLVAAVTAVANMQGLLSAPLVLGPILLAQYFLSLYHSKVELTEELAEKAQILARTNLQFAAAMVRALDTRDAYTAGHSAAVAVYTRDIAREMGFDDETVRLAHLAGLLHDIGKIGVPGRVLNKTAPLDDEEFELMKTHAAMGAEILGEVDLYKDIAVMVRYHHERIDGRGYPDKLEGEAIPAISRMISVADTYSAMTTDRPYRDGMPTEKAMSILRECRGTQLDSDFTDAFLRILIVADADYQRGKQTDFEVEVAKHQALSEVEAEAVRLGSPTPAGPKSPQVPAAPVEPVIPAAVDGELVEVELEREAA